MFIYERGKAGARAFRRALSVNVAACGPEGPRSSLHRGKTEMTIELTYLAYAIALFFVVVFVQASAGILNNGGLAMANSRDNLKPPTVFQARMKRLTDNYRENLWFFAPLVLIAAAAGISNQWTVLGAQIFFWTRLAHAIVYALGWPYIRPLFWFAGVIGCALIFLALFGILA
jgi:uncharacterized MAPEG superfamily protein